jgi:hypothetical protein
MLGDNCPHGCNVPLMRSRDKKSLVCLGCDTDFLAQTEPEKASVNQKEGKQLPSGESDLAAVVQSKLQWVACEMSRTSSVPELCNLADLATKLLALKNSIYVFSTYHLQYSQRTHHDHHEHIYSQQSLKSRELSAIPNAARGVKGEAKSSEYSPS